MAGCGVVHVDGSFVGGVFGNNAVRKRCDRRRKGTRFEIDLLSCGSVWPVSSDRAGIDTKLISSHWRVLMMLWLSLMIHAPVKSKSIERPQPRLIYLTGMGHRFSDDSRWYLLSGKVSSSGQYSADFNISVALIVDSLAVADGIRSGEMRIYRGSIALIAVSHRYGLAAL